MACRLVGIPESRFGCSAIGDPTLVPRMRAGAVLRDATERRIKAYLARLSADVREGR